MKILFTLLLLGIFIEAMVDVGFASNGVPGKCNTPGGCSNYCKQTTNTMGLCKKSKCYCAKY
uniref:AKTx n=1 Tax=Centruroides hentzi TaxID=88313 RepID=A0A2I9LNQ9_9SCOR